MIGEHSGMSTKNDCSELGDAPYNSISLFSIVLQAL